MVRALHRAGIEVILDVVYNHTAEGGTDGPLLSFRGIDNGSYYRLDDADPSRYVDYTGCGNTFDPRRPFPLQVITDSLRYWITEMHVDGFRFDLASALARSLHDVDKLSSFFDTIHQDPVISQVKLIAEPWDVGAGGYQVGEFPPLWTEWNGKYRDTVRSFWAGGASDGGARPRVPPVGFVGPLRRRRPVAHRLDQLRHRTRRLHDARPGVLRTQAQRGQRRGQPRRHRGQPLLQLRAEGDPAAQSVAALRLRQVRNLLSTLLLSTGAPMLVAGDEMWRTQGGNNNAYVQDNETSWVDWTGGPEADDVLTLTRRLLELRRRHPVLRQSAFFEGRAVPDGDGCKDLAWFTAAGRELTDRNWFDSGLRTLGMYLDGRRLRHRSARGEPIVDESFLLVLHSGDDDRGFVLPGPPWADTYRPVIDTSAVGGAPPSTDAVPAGTELALRARSVRLLQVQRD